MPYDAPPARKAVNASATVKSTAKTSAVAPVLTQRVLRLQIPDCHVLIMPVVGPVSPGLPIEADPNGVFVTILVRHRFLPSHRLTSLLLRIIHLCLGPARRPPHTSYSLLTQMLPCLCHWVWGAPHQLSPNRVRPDFDVDTEDNYPLFDTGVRW